MQRGDAVRPDDVGEYRDGQHRDDPAKRKCHAEGHATHHCDPPRRNRGSSTPYSKSTVRFEAIIVLATSRRMHCTTARSRDATDVTMRRPSPGQLNTLSVTTAPASRPPTMKPTIVTTGMAAFGKAWRRTTAGHSNPLALAVRM